MKFSKLRLISFTLACAASMVAHAEAVTIVNNTNRDSTSIINNGSCSTVLGSSGITRAHTTNVVPEMKMKLACIRNSKNCIADVYMTDNCTGNKIATAVFDVSTGMKSITIIDPQYNITASGFTVVIDGGPAFS